MELVKGRPCSLTSAQQRCNTRLMTANGPHRQTVISQMVGDPTLFSLPKRDRVDERKPVICYQLHSNWIQSSDGHVSILGHFGNQPFVCRVLAGWQRWEGAEAACQWAGRPKSGSGHPIIVCWQVQQVLHLVWLSTWCSRLNTMSCSCK